MNISLDKDDLIVQFIINLPYKYVPNSYAGYIYEEEDLFISYLPVLSDNYWVYYKGHCVFVLDCYKEVWEYGKESIPLLTPIITLYVDNPVTQFKTIGEVYAWLLEVDPKEITPDLS